MHTHPPVGHNNFTRNVKFAYLVTNVVNILTQLGCTSDLESEGGLNSTTRKLSGQETKDCKSRTCVVVSCGRRHNRLLHSDLPKDRTRNVWAATTAAAINITQGVLSVLWVKLTNRGLALKLLAVCDSRSSISFKGSVVSKHQFQGRKASLSVAGIHGSLDFNTEIVSIAVSAHEKSRSLTTEQFCVHDKLKLGDQIVDLQWLKDRYPHWYDIRHPIESKKSEDKTASWVLKSKIDWALSGPIPTKQEATLATTATSIAGGKLANQLSKWCYIESYISNCDVTSHLKEEQWAIKTLEQATRCNFERYEIGLLWRGTKWSCRTTCTLQCGNSITRRAPAERRNTKEALPRYHWPGCQSWIRPKIDQK